MFDVSRYKFEKTQHRLHRSIKNSSFGKGVKVKTIFKSLHDTPINFRVQFPFNSRHMSK